MRKVGDDCNLLHQEHITCIQFLSIRKFAVSKMGEEAEEERGSCRSKQSPVRHFETEERGSRSIVHPSTRPSILPLPLPSLPCLESRPLKHRVCPGREQHLFRDQRRALSSCRCHCHQKTPSEKPFVCGFAAESEDSVPSRVVKPGRRLEFKNPEN